MRKLSRQPNASKNKLNSLSNGFKDPREKLMIDERNKTLWLCLFKKSLLEKVLSGVKHVRLDMTARDKGAPDKGHTTLFSSSKVVHYFPNFRSYLGMEYEQPWNMGKILLEFCFFEKGTDSFWEGGIQGQALVRNPAVTFTWASDAVDLNALLVAFLEDVHPILKDGGAAILFAQGCFPTSTSSFCSADEGHLDEPILFFKSGKHFFSPVGEAPGANHNFNPLFQE